MTTDKETRSDTDEGVRRGNPQIDIRPSRTTSLAWIGISLVLLVLAYWLVPALTHTLFPE